MAAQGVATADNAADTTLFRQTSLDNVVVTGTRSATDSRLLPMTVTRIGREILEKDYDMSLIPTIMEYTPGLFATSRGVIGYGVSTNSAGGMTVRGVGGGARMLVLIDGQPQYAGLMGHPVPDAYQTMMAEDVEVVRGPASLLYGSNAMGGVVNIITREAKVDGIKTNIMLGVGSYGTVQAEAQSRLRKGRFTSVLGVNHQRTDGHRPNSDFEQTAGFYKVGYELSDKWCVNADIDLTHFRFTNPGSEQSPLFDATARITRGLASVSATNDYGFTNGVIRAYYDWGHHNVDDGHKASAKPRDYLYKHDDYIAGLTWYQSARLFEGNRTTVGVDWQNFGGEAWKESKETGLHTQDYSNVRDENEVAAYVDFRQEVLPWLTVDAGVRWDNHSRTGTEWVPQAGLAFHLSDRQDIKALVSKGFRNPTVSEMYMSAGNPDLRPERMMNYEVSYQLRSDKGRFGANVFLIDGDNLISRAPNPNGGGMLQQNIGDFRNWGVELEGCYMLSPSWRIDANYSYLNMRKKVTMAPEGKLYVGAMYRKGAFDISLGLQNVSGLYLTTGDDARKENYTLVNASASYRVLSFMRLYVKSENLLAEQYETYDGFPMPKATFSFNVEFRI